MLRSLRILLVAILLVLAGGLPRGFAQQTSGDLALRLDELRPRWEPGDRWTVETASRPLHIRADADQAVRWSSLRWQFEIPAADDLSSGDCFRVEVTCQAEGQAVPKTILWVHRDSHALRRITTGLPVPGGFEELTMSYESVSGQPAPILGPLSALPVDTPVLYGGAKGMQTFSYTSYLGTGESKALGEVAFAHQIEQQVTSLPQEEVQKLFGQHFAKSLEDDPFSKSLAERPVTEIRLKSQGREVRQLWQERRPWPIYCDNGYTVSRLVAVDCKEDRP